MARELQKVYFDSIKHHRQSKVITIGLRVFDQPLWESKKLRSALLLDPVVYENFSFFPKNTILEGLTRHALRMQGFAFTLECIKRRAGKRHSDTAFENQLEFKGTEFQAVEVVGCLLQVMVRNGSFEDGLGTSMSKHTAESHCETLIIEMLSKQASKVGANQFPDASNFPAR